MGVHFGHFASHDVYNGFGLSRPGKSFDKCIALEDADDTPVLNHRKIMLRAGQDQFHGARERVLRMEGFELGLHRATYGDAAQGVLDARHAGFLFRAHPNEEGDEEKPRIREQAGKAKQKGHGLSYTRSNLRGAQVVHAHGEQGTQDPSAVHWKSRQQVEYHEQHVHGEQPHQEIAGGEGHIAKRRQAASREKNRKEDHGDNHIDSRSCQSHPKLFNRFFGDTFEAGHPADRIERDVTGANTKPAGRQGMSIFVQNDAYEEGKDEYNAAQDSGPGVKLNPIAEAHPQNNQQEGGVHIDINSPYTSDFPGPFHVGLQRLKRLLGPIMTLQPAPANRPKLRVKSGK